MEDKLFSLLDREKIKQALYDFVRIPSPTGEERRFAEFYAEYLSNTGLEVDIDHTFSHSPSIFVKMNGEEEGPIFQFDGHTDTIPIGSNTPRIEGDVIYGRGACDMKGGLLAIAETLRVIKTAGVPLRGSILHTAHGGEEAPVGHSDELKDLLQKGIHGDVCIITEPFHDYIPITGKGMCQFKISIDRAGESIHEIQATEDTPNPILTANRLVQLMLEKERDISNIRNEYLGAGSFFFGAFKGGDFFNRIPTHVEIEGTRRFLPGQSYSEIVKEFDEFVKAADPPRAITVTNDLYNPFEPFELDPNEKLITCLRNAHQEVTGEVLPFGGTVLGGEGSLFNNKAKVPTVYYGLNGATIHSDTEYVTVDDILRAIKVLIRTVVTYLA